MQHDESLGVRVTVTASVSAIGPHDDATFELAVDNTSSQYVNYDSNTDFLLLRSGDGSDRWVQSCPSSVRTAVVLPASIAPGATFRVAARYPSDEQGTDCRVEPGAYELVGRFRGCRSARPADGYDMPCDGAVESVEARLAVTQS